VPGVGGDNLGRYLDHPLFVVLLENFMNEHRFFRRTVLSALALAPVMASLPARAQGAGPKAGRDYREVNPVQPTENPGKIEVVDFFWYGCPACNAFLPALDAWRKKLPADVSYRYLPVSFDPRNEPHTRIYYTLEALNKVGDLHVKVFTAMHREKRRLLAADEIADFAAANGIDKKQWLDTFNSFAVGTRIKRAQQVWTGYRIDGTPSVGIDGRYVTAPSMAGGVEVSLEVTDFLIDQLRKRRSGRKS
jgi:thiol:disulfide interchange protein DsbA